MSEHQGLYYEISLTNRQVLLGILILLACVVAAFLGGVWVGREAARDEGTLAAVPPEGAPTEETFRFFEPEGEEGSEPSATTPMDDNGPEAEIPIQRVQPAEPSEAESAEPSTEPAVAEATPEPSRPQTERTNGEEPATGSLVIQVFSSHDEQQARGMLERLRGGGEQAFLSPEEVSGRTMYRVRVGPFTERESAERKAAELRQQYRVDTWITRADS